MLYSVKAVVNLVSNSEVYLDDCLVQISDLFFSFNYLTELPETLASRIHWYFD